MNKILVILIFFSVSCTLFCPKTEWSPYKYGDKVRITSGFFQDQTGTIVSQSWIYNPNACNDKSFVIKLTDETKVNIEQNILEKL